MPGNSISGFFSSAASTVENAFKKTGFQSTQEHRNCNRINTGAEALGSVNFELGLVTTFSQLLDSATLIFRKNPKWYEKIFHGILAGISLARFFLIIDAITRDEKCHSLKDNVCEAEYILKCVFIAMQGSGFLSGEFSKAPYEIDSVSNAQLLSVFNTVKALIPGITPPAATEEDLTEPESEVFSV